MGQQRECYDYERQAYQLNRKRPTTFQHSGVCPAQRLHANLRAFSRKREWGLARLRGRRFGFPATRNSETVKNHPGRVGTIEGVKMDSGNVVIQEIVALFQSKVDSDPLDHFGIVFSPLDGAQKSGGKSGASGQLRNPLQPAHRRDWHNASDDWDVNVGKRAAFAKVVEVAIFKK